MKKKILMALSYLLIVALAITGTIAYLQDTDEDVNVMTLGNVEIRQNEQQRVDPSKGGELAASDLEDFVQGKPLYPYVDENLNHAMADDYEVVTFPDGNTGKIFIGDNAIDKFVSVTNTGKSDAYVRTVIALEAPTDKIDLAFNVHDWKFDEVASSHRIKVDGVEYDLFVCIYEDVLKSGETTPYNLMQIALGWNATNEETLAYGNVYDVLVLSQAVQAAGFTDAATALNAGFGEITAEKAAEWFGGEAFKIPAVVSTSDELQNVLAEAKDGEDLHIVLADDFSADDSNIGRTNFGTSAEAVFNINAGNVTIDFNGKTITANTTGGNNVFSIFMVTGNANLTVVGEGKLIYDTYGRSGGSAAFTTFGANSVINLNGDIEVEIVGSGSSLQMIYAHGSAADLGKIYVNAGTYIGKKTTSFTNLFYAQGGGNSNIVVSGGTYKVYSDYAESAMTAFDKYMTVADGYTYTASAKDAEGFVVYTVIPE